MFKVFGFIARRPDLTAEEFHAHYRHPHGTLARAMPTLLSYTQSHQIDCDLLDERQCRFEAIMEVRLADKKDWFGFRTNPYLVKHLVPDEPLFIDLKNSTGVATNEEVLPGPAKEKLSAADALWSPDKAALPVKFVQLVPTDKRDSWMTENDAALGHKIGVLHHVRCAAIEGLQPPGAEFCGVRELYWPTIAAFREGVGSEPKAWRQLVDQTSPAAMMLVQCEKFF